MESLESIRLIVTDVDGVLTDGRIYLMPDGEEIKVFNSKDGSAIRLAIRNGIPVAFLSGRGGKALSARAEELGVEHLIMFSRNKEEDFLALTGRLDISPDETAFIGDDMIDLPAMARAGFTACPSDAVPEVRARVDRILHTPGGGGVLREVVELILKARGAWPH